MQYSMYSKKIKTGRMASWIEGEMRGDGGAKEGKKEKSAEQGSKWGSTEIFLNANTSSVDFCHFLGLPESSSWQNSEPSDAFL